MLNQITPPRSPNQPPEDAIQLLMACHVRIRHFSAAAVKLAHAQAASPEDIRMSAAGVYRYLSVSLPLHEADEEDTCARDSMLSPTIMCATRSSPCMTSTRPSTSWSSACCHCC